MPGNINDFKSSFKNDVARPNRFDVMVPIPIVLAPYLNTAKSLSFRCEATELPGRSFSMAEQRFGSNPSEKYPYLTNFNDISMTFIVSDDMSEKLFFDAWMEYMSPSSSYDFRYKAEYVSTMSINQYDVAGNLTYSVNLLDALPIMMNQMDLDWSADGHHKLVVVFTYTGWQNNSLASIGSSLLQSGFATLANGQNPLTTGPFANAFSKVPFLQSAAAAIPPVPVNTLSNFVENYVDASYFKSGQKDYVIDPLTPQ